MGYATLSRSRTYIMVPRDVPPENFVTVQETRKVERVGLARCLLPPCLVVGCLLLLASIPSRPGQVWMVSTCEEFQNYFLGGGRGWNCIVPHRSCWQHWTDTRSPFTGVLNSKYHIHHNKCL